MWWSSTSTAALEEFPFQPAKHTCSIAWRSSMEVGQLLSARMSSSTSERSSLVLKPFQWLQSERSTLEGALDLHECEADVCERVAQGRCILAQTFIETLDEACESVDGQS
ncbi:MAG: hypothetical protein RLZ37_1979 [Actinomycetota bacterium]